jgi:hypothetical protein
MLSVEVLLPIKLHQEIKGLGNHTKFLKKCQARDSHSSKFDDSYQINS